MLNLITFNINDRHLLEDSFDAIKHKDFLTIVIDEQEKQRIFRQTIDAIKIPSSAVFSFQNLFKINLPHGHFYIAQCLFDFGYPVSIKGGQSHTHQYYFQLIGIANCTTELGITYIKPESWVDKIGGWFFDKDINLEGADRFNEKYFMASNKADVIKGIFSNTFVDCIAKYDDVLLTTKNNGLYISFDKSLSVNQSNIIEDIFCCSNFLSP